MRFVLLPLDERPVSLRLPRAIAAIAGIEVSTPPVEALPSIRRSGDLDVLASWFTAASAGADRAIVSLDGLGFGGLIPSRIGHETVESVLERWSALRRIDAPVYAALVVPRTPDSLDAFEEPDYWATWGPDLHALSTSLGGDEPHSDTGTPPIPSAVRDDWLGRRLRQHTLALAALRLVGDGTLARLFVGVDDAVPGSLSAHSENDLRRWTRRLGREDRITIGSGADETGAVLTARGIVDLLVPHARPRVAIVTAAQDGLDRVAPYETDSVGSTAHAQLHAAGAVVTDDVDAADAVLVIHAPDGSGADWAVAPPTRTDASSAIDTALLVAQHLRAGRAVCVADTAQPNGADPALMRALADAGVLRRLDGIAAWNTAGNSIGTAAAHLVTAIAARAAGVFDPRAAARHLRLRVIEDFGYMSVARSALRRELQSPTDRHDHITDSRSASAHAAASMNTALTALAGWDGVPIRADHIGFPWQRSFEIALDDRAGDPS